MKFGKLADISMVDFGLPEEPGFNHQNFQNLPRSEAKPTIYVGCTGWSMKEWVGTVYPTGTKSQDYLYHYSRQFSTIEFNTTHYRIPDTGTVKKWYEQSADDFRFCPKVLQRISHSRDLGYGSGLIGEFCAAIVGLKEKLGCCFIQLPPYFGVDRLPVLKNFLERWPKSIPIAVEVRHESWFASQESLEPFLKLLSSHNAGAVITDVAGRRDVLHLGVSNAVTMVRFVGNSLHPTDYTRMDRWVDLLGKWCKKGLQEVYFFPHQPDNLLAPEMCQYLSEKLTPLADQITFRGPRLLGKNNGEQMSLF